MTYAGSDGLWLHLPQGRYRVLDGARVIFALETATETVRLRVEDESGTRGVVLVRPQGEPVVLLGEVEEPVTSNLHQ